MVKSSAEKARSEEKREGWFRILVLIGSGIILSIWKMLVIVLAIVNWFIVVITGERNRDMAEFSEHYNTELYKFTRYLTFVSNRRPFPFSNMEKMSKFEK